jgi:beta-galactosidase
MKNPFTLSVAYYPEHWPWERWEQDFQTMQRCGIRAVRMFEFAWGRMEPHSGTFSFDWMHEAIKLAEKYGIEVLMCTPTEAPPPWLWNNHPDTLPVGLNGLPYGASGRRHACINSETFLLYSDRITHALAQEFAQHPNVAGWQLDNEAGCHINMRCYCENCQRKFREWVRKKYQTVEKLNEAWGLVFWSGEVQSFDEVRLHQNHLTLSNPGYELDVQRFASDSWIAFLERQANIIRQYCDQKPITHNITWYAEQIDGFKLAKRVVDRVGIDIYQNRPELINMTDTLYYSMGKKAFWVMEMGGSYTVADDSNGVILAKERHIATILRHMFHGASLCSLFRFRPSPCGGEMEGGIGNILHHDGTESETCRALIRNRDLITQLGDIFFQKQEHSIDGIEEKEAIFFDAAILWDYDDYFMIYSTPSGRSERAGQTRQKTDYVHDVLYWYDALVKAGRNPCFVTPNDNFFVYPVLVLPEKWTMTKEFAEKLHEYVRKGGVVIAADRFGAHTPTGRMSCVELPGFCSDLFGIRWDDYFSAEDPEACFIQLGENRIPVFRRIIPLQCREAAVIGTFQKGDLQGVPAVTVNLYGEGKAYYVGGLLEADGVRQLVTCIFQENGWTKNNDFIHGNSVEVISRKNVHLILNNGLQKEKVQLKRAMIQLPTQNCIDQLELPPLGFAVVQD